jgi:hypothetical protein
MNYDYYLIIEAATKAFLFIPTMLLLNRRECTYAPVNLASLLGASDSLATTVVMVIILIFLVTISTRSTFVMCILLMFLEFDEWACFSDIHIDVALLLLCYECLTGLEHLL